MQERPRYLQPDALARLKGLDLRARAVADGILQGLHRSPHRGASVEFAEHKEYVAGDEIKHVDWKVYARADRYVVKSFEHESQFQATMLIDASASMDYGAEGGWRKFDHAATMATALAYLLLRQQDKVACLVFDETTATVVPARAGLGHAATMASLLEQRQVGGKTAVDVAMRQLLEQLGRRGLIFVFSDFFTDLERLETQLRALQSRGHEMVVVQVLDGDELSFPFKEMTLFEDMESRTKLMVEPDLVRKTYLKRMAEHQERVRAMSLKMGAGYQLADTRVPPGELVVQLLRSRAAAAQGRQGRRGR